MAITPNTVNVDGQVITEFIASTAAAGDVDVNLETYMPLIDLNKAHPVLSMAAIQTETDVTGSEIYAVANEVARATAAPGGNKWCIKDANTVTINRAVDKDFTLMITYIAKGSQQA